MVAGACGVGGGQEGIVREFGMDMYTLLYLKWITNKDLLVLGTYWFHREPCSILCDSLDGRGVWGEWIHIYVWLNPFDVHQKLAQHS